MRFIFFPKALFQTSEKVTPLAQYFWENTITFVIFSHRAVTPPLAFISRTSLDIFFQILVKRLVRPAEGEGRALPIEDLRVDRSIPPACQGACKTFQKIKFTDNKRGLGELGQGGACHYLGFHAKLKSVKIYNLFLFNF